MGVASEREPVHDVLAAEAFAVPTADPALRHGHLVLPEDPTGIVEPHDVLAAEEFAMPAVSPEGGRTRRTGLSRWSRLGAAAAALALISLARRKR